MKRLTSNEYAGKLSVSPVEDIASKVAIAIRRARGPRAVCVDPQGRVTVERWADAVPADIVGHFDRSAGWPDLDLLVRDELQAAMAERRAKYG